MKKFFFVIGNPIDHSLSPKLHNYWIKKYKIDAVYEKKLLNNNELDGLIFNIREEKIHGINITVPFKKTVIPFLDELSEEAKNSQSVNTIYKKDNKIIGDNTDIEGFKRVHAGAAVVSGLDFMVQGHLGGVKIINGFP